MDDGPEKERLVAEIKANLAAAEKSEREALDALMQVHPQVRVQYFALLRDNFRDELIEAQTVSLERALPPERRAELYAETVPPKRGRGRPPGRKNKPKPPPAETVTTATDAVA